MSMTKEEYQWEEALADQAGEEALDALRDEFVAEFQQERLASYYNAHPDVHQGAASALTEAQSLLDAGFVRASLVFAVSSAEQTWNNALLRPILSGIVHSDSVAALVGRLDVRLDHLPKVLFPIIKEIGGADLSTYSRFGSTETLWSEFLSLQKLRNAVLHAGAAVTDDDASKAIGVANDLLGEVLAIVLTTVSSQRTGDP